MKSVLRLFGVIGLLGVAPAAAQTFTVTYVGNGADGGTAPVDMAGPYADGALATILSNNGGFTRSGSTFLAWNEAADGTGQQYSEGQQITMSGNVTLHAVWIFIGGGGGGGDPGGGGPGGGGPPVITVGGGPVPTYTAGGSPVAIDSMISVTDPTDGMLTGASISISNPGTFLAGDTLGWTPQTGVNGAYDSVTGILTFTGQALVATYGTLLQSVTFSSSAIDPTAGGTNTSRTIGLVVENGASSSLPVVLNVTVAAASVPKFTVSYSANGGTGTVTDATEYTSGTSVTVLGGGALTRTDFTFAGWTPGPEGSDPVYAAGATFTITTNTTLYAKWTPVPKFTVSYSANGGTGTVTDATEYTSGTSVTVLGGGALTRTDFTFAGWTLQLDGSGTVYAAGATFTITTNTTLYAKWTPVPKFTVTYNLDLGGAQISSTDGEQYALNSTATLLPVASTLRPGFRFVGWTRQQDGTGPILAGGSTITMTGDVLLYAQWEALTYSISYFANTAGTLGSGPTDSAVYAYNSSATVLGSGNLSRSGYTFAGWTKASDGSGTVYREGNSITITDNVSLYAQWTLAQPTIRAVSPVSGVANLATNLTLTIDNVRSLRPELTMVSYGPKSGGARTVMNLQNIFAPYTATSSVGRRVNSFAMQNSTTTAVLQLVTAAADLSPGTAYDFIVTIDGVTTPASTATFTTGANPAPAITVVSPGTGTANVSNDLSLTGVHFGSSAADISQVSYGLTTNNSRTFLTQNSIRFFNPQNAPSTMLGIRTQPNLLAGGRYDFTITVNGVTSDRSTATLGIPPAAPTGVRVERGDGKLFVYFTPPSNPGGFELTYTVQVIGGGRTIVETGRSSPITVSGLTNGVAYTVSVRAGAAGGTSPTTSAPAAVAPAVGPVIDRLSISSGSAGVPTDITLFGRNFGSSGASIGSVSYGPVDPAKGTRTFLTYNSSSSGGRIIFNSFQNASVRIYTGTDMKAGIPYDFTITVNGVSSDRSSVTYTPVASRSSASTGFGQLNSSAASGVLAAASRRKRDMVTRVDAITAAATADNFAVIMQPGGLTGTVVGYVGSLGLGFSVDISVAADGRFTGQTQALTSTTGTGRTLTFSGSITDGVLSGVIVELGLSFAVTLAENAGDTAAVTGFYEATSPVEGAARTISIVGPGGQVFVLALTATGVDGGVGTITAEGTYSIITAQGATVAGAVNPTTTTTTATISSSTGSTIDVAGSLVAVVPFSRLSNLSALGDVGATDVIRSGFVIRGSASKSLLLRAVGPSLSSYGVGNALARPSLTVFDADGQIIQTNRGWANSGELVAAAAQAGAFPLVADSQDSALLATLEPGVYTAHVGGGGAGGRALMEIYDLDAAAASAVVRLVNESVFGSIKGESSPLIAGFVVEGNTPKRLLIRGVGPALSAFGVSPALVAPQLRLFDSAQTLLARNEAWGTPETVPGGLAAASAAAVEQAASTAGAFALTADSLDTAIVVTLPPGAYTVHLVGRNAATGNGLVEIYQLP